jgi:HD domain
MDFAALIDPPTTTAAMALEVSAKYCSPALLHHSIRSYTWGVDYARRNDIGFDAELYYVASLLHDVGLTPEFDSHDVPFEEAGGHVAWVFAAAAGWSRARRDRVSEIIVLHMRDDVDAAADAESHLLQVATTLDISGTNAALFSPKFTAAIVERVPRLDLSDDFGTRIEAQAARKPEGAAAGLVRGGLTHRLAANPL